MAELGDGMAKGIVDRPQGFFASMKMHDGNVGESGGEGRCRCLKPVSDENEKIRLETSEGLVDLLKCSACLIARVFEVLSVDPIEFPCGDEALFVDDEVPGSPKFETSVHAPEDELELEIRGVPKCFTETP